MVKWVGAGSNELWKMADDLIRQSTCKSPYLEHVLVCLIQETPALIQNWAIHWLSKTWPSLI